MPLLREDIDRLTYRGYYDVYFADEYNGAKVIRKVGGKCVFFEDGECEVFDIRPTRCRFPQITYDNETKTVKKLESCLHKSQIRITPDEAEAMEKFIQKLIKEIEKRINYNPKAAALGRVNDKITVIR